MPAGVSLSTYLKFATAAFLSMGLGSQCMHMYYRPLDDLEELVEQNKDKILPEHIKTLLKDKK